MSPLCSHTSVILFQDKSRDFSGVISRTPSDVKPDVQVLIVFAVGRRLKIARLRMTRYKSAMRRTAAINLSAPITTALAENLGNGTLKLRSSAEATVTNTNRLLWNML